MQVKNRLRALTRILFLNAPIDAQLIITRRCNLSCGYCFEYDNSSEPVPLQDLRRRIDALHRLKVVNITLLGGEPLMHPDVAEVVAYAGRESNTSIITNGFLIGNTIIEKLNDAGLNNMQVSIDTLHPDPSRYIQKSLKSLRPKLERLKRLARFDVHVTAVLCESSKDQFGELMNEIRALGLRMSISLIHDERGHISISGQPYLDLWQKFYQDSLSFSYIDHSYGTKLLKGERPAWKCRAGARYLYVDEFGKVQLCATQLGRLDKPVEEYTQEDVRVQSETYKGCESGCTMLCSYRCSAIDNDKPALVKALAKGYLKGTLSDNGLRSARRY
ncbi:MAG: radical SAM protein [Anaerolineae bacterium]